MSGLQSRIRDNQTAKRDGYWTRPIVNPLVKVGERKS